LAGLFLPPWAGRLVRRSGAGVRAAEVLTEMARDADLRPPASAGRAVTGSAFASRALPLAVLLYVVTECLHG
jgi:hypothetical protein